MKSYNTIIGAMSVLTITTLAAFAHGEQTSEEGGALSWQDGESIFLDRAVADISRQRGFKPSLGWIGEFWSNVSNGRDISSMADTLFTMELEQDLSALIGKGSWGKIGISAFYYAQTNGGQLGGFDSSQGSFSNIVAGNMCRVFEIYYCNEFETKFGNIAFRAGQLAADEDFMGMDYSDVFLNSSFGAMPNVAPGNLFSQYNVATLGLVVYYSLGNFDATFGVYNGNIGPDISSNNGFDYSHTFDSVAFWYQFGYNYSIGGLSGRAMFGGNYHSDTGKANFDAFGGGAFYSFFFGIEQALLNDSQGNAKFGVYARVGIVPDSEVSDNNFYADFGFNLFSPIPGRTCDVFAAGFSVIENERGARTSGSAHYEGALEITYRCQLTPAISIQPDFQLFVNPNNRNESGAAYIVGVRAEVIF